MNKAELKIILELISKGDKESFRKFFDHFYAGLINYSTYILKSKFMAEEIVSSVFINVWKHKEDVIKINNIESYLYVSVKNKCYNSLRDQKTVLFDVMEEDILALKTELHNPESLYLDVELNDRIQKSLNSLPPRSRMVFQLVKEDGLKYKEVAELLDISVKTVEVHMGRAVGRLRKLLQSYVQRPKIPMPISKIANLIIALSFYQIF